MEHEHEENAVWENQIATLDKIETALEDLSKLLQARGALTAAKQREIDELVIQIIEEKLALWRENIAK